MELGKQIKRLRIEKGLSQSQLAKKSNISLKTLQRYEKEERSPTLIILQMIADALEIDFNKLITISKAPSLSLTNKETETILKNIDTLRKNGGLKLFKMEFIKAEIDFSEEEELLACVLLRKFFSLNDIGQQKIVSYIEDIYKLPEYKKGNVEK